MSLFRIDKATVSYQNTEKPFLVRHANVGQYKMPIFATDEDGQEESAEPSEGDTAALSPDKPEPEKTPDIQLPDPVKLIEEARVQAEAVRIQAQSDAQAMLDKAKAQVAKIEKEARDKGYKEGLQKGNAEGKASYDKSIHSRMCFTIVGSTVRCVEYN